MTPRRPGARGRAPRHLQARRRRPDRRSRTLGFRGEALPSIGSVARLAHRHAATPASRTPGRSRSTAARSPSVKPAALSEGTRVEVRDLFYATPARLKFLKSDRTEAEAVRDVVRRLAMSRPTSPSRSTGEERAPVTWPAALPGAPGRLARLADILGRRVPRQRGRGRRRARGRAVDGFAGAADAHRAPTRSGNICSSTAGRCATSCCSARCAAPMPTICRATAIRWWRCSSTLPTARGRRQRASGQDRGALPRRRRWCARC